MSTRHWLLAVLLATSGCDLAVRIHDAPPQAGTKPRKSASVTPPVATASSASNDARPPLPPPKSFEPAGPQVFEVDGLKVWLAERPTLPIVTASFVSSRGAGEDPADKPGVTHLMNDMLDEGAGKLGAVALSTAVSDLGASLSTGTTADGSFASVSSLKQNFAKSFGLLTDVVARPRLEEKEFRRIAGLWKNALKKRADDPGTVAMVVAQSAIFGRESRYGHPTMGLLSKAEAIGLSDIKAAYSDRWRREKSLLVISGQITRSEVEALLRENLGQWKSSATPSSSPTPSSARPKLPELIVVDRPGSVQSMIVVAREGVTASSESYPALGLLNTALGGSFTSRLNLNLREEKGWTYGAGSSFMALRDAGMFYIRTSVERAHTGEAVSEIRREVKKMSAEGLTSEELSKVLAQDRAELVDTYETVGGLVGRLGSLSALGLPPTFDAGASRLRQATTSAQLASLARLHLEGGVIIIVGDHKEIEKDLATAGLPSAELWSAEGVPLKK